MYQKLLILQICCFIGNYFDISSSFSVRSIESISGYDNITCITSRISQKLVFCRVPVVPDDYILIFVHRILVAIPTWSLALMHLMYRYSSLLFPFSYRQSKFYLLTKPCALVESLTSCLPAEKMNIIVVL